MAALSNDIYIDVGKGYKLDYLISDGYAYINTGYKVQKGDKIVVEFMYTALPTNNALIFGAYSYSHYGVGFYFTTSGQAAYLCESGYGNMMSENVLATRLNTKFTVTLETNSDGSGVITLKNGDDTWSHSTATYFSASDSETSELQIFKQNASSSTNLGNYCKIYSLKIYSSDAIVHEYIPMKFIDNSLGVFDTVLSKKFNNARSTGSFTYGSAESTLYPEPYHFQNDNLFNASAETAVALVGEELCIDTFTATVKDSFENTHAITLFRPADQVSSVYTYDGIISSDQNVFCNYETISSGLVSLAYALPVYWYNDQILKGKYYLKAVERTGENRYRINAMSAIGLLDKQYHVGGIYTGATLKTVVDEIIGDLKDTIIPYTFESEVETRTVYGWLPYDTKRNNLYQALFATNTNLIKTSAGQIIFTKLINTSSSTITDANIFDNGSVEYDAEASEVQVAEHIIKALGTEDEETLFDNSSGTSVTNQLVKFSSAPIQVSSIRSPTLTINESGVNYAIVTGQGILYGKPYTHTTNVLRKVNTDASEEKVVSCEDATLVTSMNGTSVLERLYKYYVTSKRVKIGIVLNNERCGNKYTFRDAFNELSTGFLEKMSVVISSFAKAQCEFVSDYNPYTSSGYSHQAILSSSSGTWTVPTGITQIRVTMISGGQGGSSGKAGESGTIGSITTAPGGDGSAHEAGDGGAGGEAGTPGTGGRVHTEILTVTEGQTFSYTCGTGGSGGALSTSHSTSNAGSLGTDTTFGSYSTEDYSVMASGFLDVFTGTIYGLSATDDGVDGGDGGDGGTYQSTQSASSVLLMNGNNGGDVTFNGTTYGGGNGATRTYLTVGSIMGTTGITECGGGGSGAVAGKKGGNGYYAYSNYGTDANNPVYSSQDVFGQSIYRQDLTLQGTTWDGQKTWRNWIANNPPYGAAGLTPDARLATTVFGQGGLAGHGGSGGGGNGYFYDWVQDWSTIGQPYVEQMAFVYGTLVPAQGGNGGAGGKGGDGCIIIYY